MDNEAKQKSVSFNKKEIEIIEVEWEKTFFPENDRVVRKHYQIACAFGANLMMACYGLVTPASAFLIPQLEDPINGFGITLDEGSWLASIMVLGSLSGAFCGGVQSGKLGRRKSLMIDCFNFVLGTFLVALAPNFYVILIGRFIHGHSSASAMVAIPIYTSEISQPQIRKTTGSFALICYSTGFALALILGAIFPWRFAIGSILIAPVGCFFLLCLCPETPVWYMINGREEDAKQSLIKLRGRQNQDIIDAEFNRIALSLKIEEKEMKINAATEKKGLLDMIPTELSFWKPFSFLLLVFPISLEWTGLPAIAFYMVSLLQKSNIPLDPFWASALLASYRALIAILASTISGMYKKRPIYLTSWGIFLVGLLSLTAYSFFNQNGLLTDHFPVAKWIPIFSILIYYTGYSLGFGSIPYMLQGELLPSSSRSFGSGLLGVIDNLSLFISTKMVPTWFELLGIHGTLLMYACFCGFVGIMAFFFMPETTGLSLEDIENMYKTKKKAKIKGEK